MQDTYLHSRTEVHTSYALMKLMDTEDTPTHTCRDTKDIHTQTRHFTYVSIIDIHCTHIYTNTTRRWPVMPTMPMPAQSTYSYIYQAMSGGRHTLGE